MTGAVKGENRPIVLITDFGLGDPFVGAMKGVIISINPEARMVDLTHDISPYNILQAAVTIKSSYAYFPEGTIFLAVVDPTVGSDRKKILVEARGRYLVGPDNGIFWTLLEETPAEKIILLKNSKYFLKTTSKTFHGRDVFAPVAAWLSLGADCTDFGPPQENISELHIPQATLSGNYMITGEVLFSDHFGNLTTNITMELLQKLDKPSAKSSLQVSVKKERIGSLTAHYSQGEGPSALINSWGYLEIYVPRGNAGAELGITVGEPVWVTID